MVAWKETYGQKGTGSSFQHCNKLVGDEIFFTTDTDISYISTYFLHKWHTKNKDKEVLFNNRSALTSLKIGGRLYPVFFKLTDDFSPMTLGQEFFRQHNWSINTDGIDTPYGRLGIHQGVNRLDTDLADKVFTVETLMSKKQKGLSREDQIIKLHRYFGHCHADSLWRIIRQSSNTDEFTQAEIEKVCGECHNCQLSKRKSPRKKTSLPRSSSFNEVVTMDRNVLETEPIFCGWWTMQQD